MGRTYDGAARLVQETAGQAGHRVGTATEYAGRQVGDVTERTGSGVEDTATRIGTRMQIGSASGDGEVEIDDHGDEFVVTTDLPGFSKNEIDTTLLAGQTLRIRAEHDDAPEESDESYLHRERHHGSVRRSVALPNYADGEDATAAYRNGVLTVTIPKVDPKVPVKEDTATVRVENHDVERIEDPAEDTDAGPVDVFEDEPSVEAAVEGSVADLTDALATGEYDNRLDAVEDAEREGEDRATAHEAIDDRREEIRDARE